MNKEKKYSSPYEFEGRLPLKQAIPMGLQHVLAMFVGNLTPILSSVVHVELQQVQNFKLHYYKTQCLLQVS